MAVTFAPAAGVQRTAHGYSVLPDNVVVIPELSGRSEATDVTELAADIKAHGQLENAVCWKNDEGFPVLAAGHRRDRAIALLNTQLQPGEEPYRLLFSYIQVRNEQEAFDYTIRENRNRVNPSPLDDATNMHIYQTRYGLNEEQIAKKYYPSITNDAELTKAVAEVRTTLKLLELSDDAKEALRNGRMSTSAAVQLASIPSRKHQDEVVRTAVEQGKKVKVADAKAAKAVASGKAEATSIPTKSTKSNIVNNTPVKMLEKYRRLSELAGSLATENMCKEWGRHPDREVIFDYASQILVICAKLSIPLDSGADTWAHEHINQETSMDEVLS